MSDILEMKKKLLIIFSSIYEFFIPRFKEIKQYDHDKKLGYVLKWVAIITLIIGGYTRSGCSREKSTQDIFSSSDSFKILILPFNEYGCQGNYDCGELVAKRLNMLKLKDSLNLEVYYYSDYVLNSNFTRDTAEHLRIANNADLIVYGDYFTRTENSISDDKVTLNFICAPHKYIPVKVERTTNEMLSCDLTGINSGRLQGNIEFLVYWIAGRAAYDKDNYHDAEEKFTYILENIDRSKYLVHFYLGLSYIHQNKLIPGLQSFLKSSELNINERSIALNIGATYALLGRYEDAINIFSKTIEIYPSYFDAYLNLGGVYLNKKLYNESIHYLSKAIELDTSNYRAFEWRGLARTKSKDYKGALEDLDNAIVLKPIRSELFFRKGILKALSGDYNGAINEYGLAIQIDSTNESYFIERGIAYSKIDSFAAALLDFKAASIIAPDSPEVYFNRGCVYLEQGRYLDAEINYTKQISLDSTNPKAYNNLGATYYHLEEYDKSIQAFTKGIILDSNDPEKYLNRAKAIRQIEHYDSALADINRSIFLDNNYAEAYYEASMINFEADSIILAYKYLIMSAQLGYSKAIDRLESIGIDINTVTQ